MQDRVCSAGGIVIAREDENLKVLLIKDSYSLINCSGARPSENSSFCFRLRNLEILKEGLVVKMIFQVVESRSIEQMMILRVSSSNSN